MTEIYTTPVLDIERICGFSIYAEKYCKAWNPSDGKFFLFEKVGEGDYGIWFGRLHIQISDERIDRRKVK